MLRAAGIFSVGTVGASAYGYRKAQEELGPDSVHRLLSFYSVAVPMVVDYKSLEIKCEVLPQYLPSIFPPVSEAEEAKLFEPLHEKWKDPLVDKLFELGGFFYKNGQRGAGNMGGFVPKIYQDALEPFMDQIPPRDFEKQILPLIEEEFGKPFHEIFESIDPKPIGCASIGQAHRAILKQSVANGNKVSQESRRVVVKVQDPTAEKTFRGDVFALRSICKLFFPQGLPAFDEMERQFATEFDYRREAKNGSIIRTNLLEKFPDVIVPEVYPDLCTKRVLVMEEIYPAVPLIQALEKQAESFAKQQGFKGATKEFIALEKIKQDKLVLEAAKRGEVVEHVDANAMSKYIMLQQAKAKVYQVGSWLNPWAWLSSSSSSSSSSSPSSNVFIPLNMAKIMDDLLDVHGYEVFINGVFNGDPHPGNILYISGDDSKDGRPKLGLIDYGQVKTITDEFRLKMAKLFMLTEAAMLYDPRTTKVPLKNQDDTKGQEQNQGQKKRNGNNSGANLIDYEKAHRLAVEALAKNMTDLGFRSEKMLSSTMYEICTVYYGRDDPAWLYPLNFIQWSDQIQAKDPLGDIKEVEDAVMITMAGLYLRGLGHSLQQPRNLAKAWKPYAEQALRDAGKLDEVLQEIDSWTK